MKGAKRKAGSKLQMVVDDIYAISKGRLVGRPINNMERGKKMKITKIICSEGRTGFYFDDQKAIKQGAKTDGNMYVGELVTKGFTSVRQAGNP